MEGFSNARGKSVLLAIVKAVQDNKAYLGEIDGLIGDGDHGMNMNKGVTLFAARYGSKDISFTVARSDAQHAKEVMEEHKEAIGCQSVEVSEQVAKVSIVGAGMVNNAGVACKMFEALYSAGININMISTSEIKVSVLLDERDADRAVQAIHDRFFSEFGNA